MNQPAIYIMLGLSFDIVGFIFLVREVAKSHDFEKSSISITKLTNKINEFLVANGSILSNISKDDSEGKEIMEGQIKDLTGLRALAERSINALEKKALGIRKSSLWFGAFLIFLGFVLQIIGTYKSL